MTKRDLFWSAVGVLVAVWVGYPMAQRQAAWEARTISCWPTNDDPNPVRHP